jgi:ABC-type enterochelin transport system permease subunit
MLLLLPVAYLLSIGWRWAAIIPLATATILVAFTPAIVYPIAFYATLLATVAAGWRPALVSRAAKPSFA